MGRRRGKSAVAAATESGFEAESVQEGIDDILGMAGPAQEPDNLGNFKPDLGDDPREHRPRQPSPPSRRARPQPLATPEDESAAARALRGGRPDPEPSDDDVDEQPPSRAARPELEDTPEGEDDGDLDPRDRELAELRAWRAERDLADQDRDTRLNRALDELDRQRTGGRGAAPAGDAVDADPRAVEIARRLRPENIVPFAIDEVARENLGLTPQGGKTLDAMFRAQATHIVQLMLHAYNLDQELTRTQSSEAERTAARESDEITRARDAFYAGNRDLVDYQSEVTWLSREVAEDHARRTGRRISPAEWIPETSRRVREHLRSRGVRVAPYAPAYDPRGGGRGVAPGASLGRGGGRARPAGMDYGAGGGGNGKTRLTPLEDEMFAMARAGQ